MCAAPVKLELSRHSEKVRIFPLFSLVAANRENVKVKQRFYKLPRATAGKE